MTPKLLVGAFSDQGGHPRDRLAALATYLGLDWLWRRCADLGEHGCAGLVYPRSRLLSTNAIDAALRFTGMLGRNAAAR